MRALCAFDVCFGGAEFAEEDPRIFQAAPCLPFQRRTYCVPIAFKTHEQKRAPSLNFFRVCPEY
eukprot:3196885-Amphidinium_carterae.1